jgi:hypothetical protein
VKCATGPSGELRGKRVVSDAQSGPSRRRRRATSAAWPIGGGSAGVCAAREDAARKFWARRAAPGAWRGAGPRQGASGTSGRTGAGLRPSGRPAGQGPRPANARRTARPGRAPVRAPRPEMRQDPIDDRRQRDARDDPHRAAARGAHERIHLVDLPQQLGPPVRRLGATERARGHQHDGRVRVRWRCLPPPHPARAIGIPAVVALRDLALIGDVCEHSRQKLHKQYARSRLGIVSTTCRCGTGARTIYGRCRLRGCPVEGRGGA